MEIKKTIIVSVITTVVTMSLIFSTIHLLKHNNCKSSCERRVTSCCNSGKYDGNRKFKKKCASYSDCRHKKQYRSCEKSSCTKGSSSCKSKSVKNCSKTDKPCCTKDTKCAKSESCKKPCCTTKDADSK